MTPKRILLPLDIRACPLEIFSLAESFARRSEVTLVLLHVVHLNIATPDNRLYRELTLEARWYLMRLARQYLHPRTSTLLHVRVGDPAEQILEEVKSEKIQMIILPVYGPSFWKQMISAWKPGFCQMVSPLADRIIRDSACGVFVASVETRFNCEKAWRRPMGEARLARDGSKEFEELRLEGQEDLHGALLPSHGSF